MKSRWGPWDGRCQRCGGDGPFRPRRRTCKPCEAAARAAQRQADPEKARATDQKYYRAGRERDPERYRAYVRKGVTAYRERHRERLAEERREREASPEFKERYGGMNVIRATVSNALKSGRLVRPDRCEQCQSIGTVEAAHEDYSQPLKVRWLCRSCHRRWDHDVPKTR